MMPPLYYGVPVYTVEPPECDVCQQLTTDEGFGRKPPFFNLCQQHLDDLVKVLAHDVLSLRP